MPNITTARLRDVWPDVCKAVVERFPSAAATMQGSVPLDAEGGWLFIGFADKKARSPKARKIIEGVARDLCNTLALVVPVLEGESRLIALIETEFEGSLLD